MSSTWPPSISRCVPGSVVLSHRKPLLTRSQKWGKPTKWLQEKCTVCLTAFQHGSWFLSHLQQFAGIMIDLIIQWPLFKPLQWKELLFTLVHETHHYALSSDTCLSHWPDCLSSFALCGWWIPNAWTWPLHLHGPHWYLGLCWDDASLEGCL